MRVYGSYSHAVDAKSRTVIPHPFRSEIGRRFYMTRGVSGCLWLFPEDEWKAFQEAMTPKDLLDVDGLKLERFFVGSAVECTPDSQGRIFIPQDLKKYAGIKDSVYIVGLGSKVEIWASDRWEEFQTISDEEIQKIGRARLRDKSETEKTEQV